MTATAQVQSYAIGPSLYDFERDAWEREADRHEAFNARIEEEAETTKSYLASIGTVMASGERTLINEMMAEAMALFADHESDQDQLNRWLWQVWACHTRQNRGATEKALAAFAVQQVVNLIDKAIDQVARQQAKDRMKP